MNYIRRSYCQADFILHICPWLSKLNILLSFFCLSYPFRQCLLLCLVIDQTKYCLAADEQTGVEDIRNHTMSRVYLTASMPHEKFGVGLPTLSFETNDHTGGGYDIAGLHPSSIATLFGKGPEIKKGERFDLKFNLNAKRYESNTLHNPLAGKHSLTDAARKGLPCLWW